MPLGIYISVPFCRSKCSFCNFASGVFSRELFDRYLDRVIADIQHSAPAEVDSVYLGGGTPSVLAPDQLRRLFAAVRQQFTVLPDAEITVECAPGTLAAEMIDALRLCGANRVSLGVQSFIDQESRAVGRLHTRDVTLRDIANLRAAGIENISIDLIAGLPHQTADSWLASLEETIDTGVPHVSVYMLEVDEDSRLGRELIAGGTRYHAHYVPDDDTTADFYQQACDVLTSAGIDQYEISNFARDKARSKHNLKYWLRYPYLGFGVDAHSMVADPGGRSLRTATADDLDKFLAGSAPVRRIVDRAASEDEAFFLGLRLNQGILLSSIAVEFGDEAVTRREPAFSELIEAGLIFRDGDRLALTGRGRLLSNEVFERFTLAAAPSESADLVVPSRTLNLTTIAPSR